MNTITINRMGFVVKVNKKILMLSVALLLPIVSQANPLIGIAGGVVGIAGGVVGVSVGAVVIGSLVLPSVVGYHAGLKREELQANVENFKKELTAEQIVVFNENYKAVDTSIGTKAPVVMQVLGCGFVNKVRTVNSMANSFSCSTAYRLSPMGKMTQVAALAVACADEYVEYKNRENFKDAVKTVQSLPTYLRK
jgi:hypothetical protein